MASFCKYCGASLNKGYAFCLKCGKPVQNPVTGSSENSASSSPAQKPSRTQANPTVFPLDSAAGADTSQAKARRARRSIEAPEPPLATSPARPLPDGFSNQHPPFPDRQTPSTTTPGSVQAFPTKPKPAASAGAVNVQGTGIPSQPEPEHSGPHGKPQAHPFGKPVSEARQSKSQKAKHPQTDRKGNKLPLLLALIDIALLIWIVYSYLSS